jgi:predicted Zn-dependent protease
VLAAFWPMADRYTYVPLIGIFVILSWGGAALAGNRRSGKAVAGVVACVALVLLGAATHRQCKVWRSSLALYAHALEVTADNHLMHFSMAGVLAGKGYPDLAVDHYRKAVDIQPGNPVLQYFFGKALAAQGKHEAAARHLSEAVRLHPDYPKAIEELARVRGKLEEKNRSSTQR